MDEAAVGGAYSTLDAGGVYAPSTGRLVLRDAATAADRIDAARAAYTTLAAAVAAETGRLGKAEARLGVLTKGYEVRAGALNTAVAAAAAAATDKDIELACYVRLAYDEAAALPVRLEVADALAAAAAAEGKALQDRYRGSVSEISELRKLLASAGVAV